MLITSAYAQASSPLAGLGAAGGEIQAFLPIILIFVVFYFMLIRPQQKRAKQHKEMLTAIRRGDRVVTSGGILGTVTKVVSDTEVAVEIAEGVRVRVLRATIQDILTKTEPVAAGKEVAEPANDGDKAADK